MAQQNEKKTTTLTIAEMKKRAENGGYFCPGPLSIGIVLNIEREYI
jgi:hypothetical protein